MRRRKFLTKTIAFLFTNGIFSMVTNARPPNNASLIHLFMCGDVMTGRGIDQILANPSEPQIFEPYIKNATDYVLLAEKQNGMIKKPVSFDYIWGDALQALNRIAPDVRIINLETSITTHNRYWPGKGIQYRMHPKNTACLTAADIDICTLANNHVLDWSHEGLIETLSSLHNTNIKTSGAGINLSEAQKPAVKDISDKGRVLVYSFAHVSSGTPTSWRATQQKPGVNLLNDFSIQNVYHLAQQVREIKRKNDIVIASIHWGGNWGYEVDSQHRQFAHELIDYADVDIIHGHSSHHPKGIEVYKNKPVIYGCGDFLNDYEGISGHEDYRGDLGFMYFLTMNAGTGNLNRMQLIPTQIKKLRIQYADKEEKLWLQQMLNREGLKLGTRVINENNELLLTW